MSCHLLHLVNFMSVSATGTTDHWQEMLHITSPFNHNAYVHITVTSDMTENVSVLPFKIIIKKNVINNSSFSIVNFVEEWLQSDFP